MITAAPPKQVGAGQASRRWLRCYGWLAGPAPWRTL